MRKYIITQKLEGELTVGNKYVFENVKGEFNYDIYSNRYMNGYFDVRNIGAAFLNDFMNINDFNFKGLGIKIKGDLTSVGFGGNNRIEFDINEFQEWSMNKQIEPTKMKISYKLPYISLLGRNIRTAWNDEEDYIVKYQSEKFTISLKNFKIVFYEDMRLIEHDKPDYILNRKIVPAIEMDINQYQYSFLFDTLKPINHTVNDSMMILSMIIYKRFNTFGYTVELLDESNSILQQIIYKSSKGTSGEEHKLKDDAEFNKYFTDSNLASLIEAYISLEMVDKEKFARIIYAYLTIDELRIFEPSFRDAFFLLEAICKLLLKPVVAIHIEKMIEECCKIASIDLLKINFQSSIASKDLKWMITEYRNELTHYNFNLEFDNSVISIEFRKMMYIIRRLMIYYLVPELSEFPYPEGRYSLRYL